MMLVLVFSACYRFNEIKITTLDTIEVMVVELTRDGIEFYLENISNYDYAYSIDWLLEELHENGLWLRVINHPWGAGGVSNGTTLLLGRGEKRRHINIWNLPPGRYRHSHSVIRRFEGITPQDLESEKAQRISIEFILR